jgi:hypothetical protein
VLNEPADQYPTITKIPNFFQIRRFNFLTTVPALPQIRVVNMRESRRSDGGVKNKKGKCGRGSLVRQNPQYMFYAVPKAELTVIGLQILFGS